MEEKNPAAPAVSAEEAKKTSEDYFADFDFGKAEINLEEMLKNGVHFGHQKSRKNPKMEDFIFTTRKGINIINLEKTAEALEKAGEFLRQVRREGKKVLLVATKKQMTDLVRSLAKRTDMPFVVERWLGGTFTNFKVIKGRTTYLRESQEKMKAGEFKKYTKLEQLKKGEELEDLERRMGGIKNMTELPGAVLVTDLILDDLAVKEAKHRGIPVVALADTNTDPSKADYSIPANDDAISSVRLILGYLGGALLESKAEPKGEAKQVQ